MDHNALLRSLTAFGLNPDNFTVKPIGAGLIHSTYVVQDQFGKSAYILQHLNNDVFRIPEDISWNLERLQSFLEVQGSSFFVPFPVKTALGHNYHIEDGKYFRLSPFVPGSHAVTICTSPGQAYEAAQQFGRFTAAFSGFDATALRYTIPRFHDLTFRWEQFLDATRNGDNNRITEAGAEIKFLAGREDVVRTYASMVSDPACMLRVTHHDTKISNVLFDETEKGICVIDLDTVMPGYHISDLGDMYRTYLSPASEEELDLDLVHVRTEYLEAIREGYLSQMQDLLTSREIELLDYAGSFMIYMQALRFLTDHLNKDIYYGARYEGHNLVRARNQIRLLQSYEQS
jgi:Ser/Thr protein kinase RdoA (MazF antagonist)